MLYRIVRDCAFGETFRVASPTVVVLMRVGSKADERRASLRAAVHEWCERQDPQDVAKKRRVHETTVSVQDSCLVGVSAAMAALQWVKKNAA